MPSEREIVRVRCAGEGILLVPLASVNSHRAEWCARHDADAGLRAYDEAFAAELDYGRSDAEMLRDWAERRMGWDGLRAVATVLRESCRG